MGKDLATPLAVAGFGLAGDNSMTTRWSIGGPLPPLMPIIGSPAPGLNNTHNTYEGDGSATRVNPIVHNLVIANQLRPILMRITATAIV
jgi:hypothetical protein